MAEQRPPAIPLYRAHKIVRAAKITMIDRFQEKVHFCFEVGQGSFICGHEELLHKPEPRVGMYLIQYVDQQNTDVLTYFSFSPALEFEEGYSKVENA